MNTVSSTEKQRPWYQHFWVWFVIALPASAVIAGIATVVIAVKNADSLVSDEYYKEGLGVNQNIEKEQYALQVLSKMTVDFDSEQVMVSLQAKPQQPVPAALMLDLLHPTLEKHDIHLVLHPDASGVYRAALEQNVFDGKWLLHISNIQQTWLIKQVMYWPVTEPVSISL